jgi:hypothetical protein
MCYSIQQFSVHKYTSIQTKSSTDIILEVKKMCVLMMMMTVDFSKTGTHA